MNNEEIVDNNKLIAEFMGAIADTGESEGWWSGIMFPHGYDRTLALKYHSSWDWLMPVVDKIEKDYNLIVKFADSNIKIWSSLYCEGLYFGGNFSDINKLYNRTVLFIKWYNKNKDNETN